MSYSLSFSKAVFVIVFVADKIRQGQTEYLSSQNISKVLNIPKPTLVKMLKSMADAGIIETREGKQGGIRLGKNASDITVLDILNAVDSGKPLFHNKFDIAAEGKRPDNAKKILVSLFSDAESEMKEVLATKTIAALLEEM